MVISGHEDEPPLGYFQRFVHSEVSGSALLLISTAAAMALANSRWAGTYFGLLSTKLGLDWGHLSFALTAQHWINDLLMVVFFFVVGLEIKRELVVGELSSARKAALPVMAALGGMVVPALVYSAINAGGDAAAGWGIPMATDIAFALGVLSLFGSRVPVGLKVFLTAVAIVDDLGAVLVIAAFYTARVQVLGLLAAAACLALIGLANRFRVRQPALYVFLALGVWAGVYASGVHATVAGVLVAFLIPVRAERPPSEGDAARASDARPAGLALEEAFHPYVVFAILPLFALVNAGVALDGSFAAAVAHPASIGIVAGLVVGKQVGVALFSWLAVKSGRAALPEGVRWIDLYGGACLAGIGFTMSLFIADLALADPAHIASAKVGILVASGVAATCGGAVLLRASRSNRGRQSDSSSRALA